MSKQVLALLAKNIAKDIDAQTWQGDSKVFRQGQVEVKHKHYVLKFTEQDIYQQIKDDLALLDLGKKTAGNRAGSVPEEAVRRAAKAYYDKIMSTFTSEELKAAQDEGSGKYIAVTNNYSTLSKKRMKPADDLAKNIINSYLPDGYKYKDSTKIMAPDHTDANADIRFSKALHFAAKSAARKEAISMGASPDEVSVNRINEIALETLSDLGNVSFEGSMPVNTTTRDVFAKTYSKITSKFTHGDTQKDYDLTVGFEVSVRSAESNRLAGDVTKGEVDKLRKAAANLAGKHNWAGQESSDSFIDATLKRLNNAAVKAGATGKIQRINNKPATVRETVVRKIKQVKTESKPRVRVNVSKKKESVHTTGPQLSLSYIVNYINARLPEQVISNMGEGTLVNRTGQFANSTKITSWSMTPQGYPSLAYTYQRSPYDVFDPTRGRKPWNTPGRDPNALIKRSVREIAQDLAIGRFYLRRA